MTIENERAARGERPGVTKSSSGTIRAGRAAVLAAAAVGAVLALAAPAEEQAPEPASLPETMQRTLGHLEQVLPASVDRDSPMTDEQRAAYIEGIDRLLADMGQLEQLAADRDRGFRHLTASLAVELADIRRLLARGEDEMARYFLVQATSNCVACHARLPASPPAIQGEALFDRVAADATSVHERTQLLVATRQFDRAVAEWEALFADPEFAPSRLEIDGYLLDYLTIQLRVRRDRMGARQALVALSKREDVPKPMAERITHWLAALARIEATPAAERTSLLERARYWIEEPLDPRDRLIEDLEASAMLLQYIDGSDEDDPRLGEAYYWLGFVEARGVDGYWVPQTEAHLEAAIRTDPQGEYASPAYALLESYVRLGYGVDDDVELPEEESERLLALRELLEGAPAELE